MMRQKALGSGCAFPSQATDFLISIHPGVCCGAASRYSTTACIAKGIRRIRRLANRGLSSLITAL
jgi:hypothetical protein